MNLSTPLKVIHEKFLSAIGAQRVMLDVVILIFSLESNNDVIATD